MRVLTGVAVGLLRDAPGTHPARYNRPMPIFEYVCSECDHRFETLVTGATAPQCPACLSSRLAKQFSVFAVATRTSGAPRPGVAGPCGSCGHPDGPGACSLN